MSEIRWTVNADGDPEVTNGYGKPFALTRARTNLQGVEHDALVAAVRDADRLSVVRRLVYELAHGNRPQLFEGRLHWYSPERADDGDTIPERLRGYLGDPDSLADDIDAQIHIHCGDDGQSDEHNDWVSDLTGQIMNLLGIDAWWPHSPDETARPHFLNAALTDVEVAEWEALEARE